jgi:DNA-binding NarL/FixJ family response regulator
MPTVRPAIEAGATGYLLNDAPRRAARAVRAAARGESVLGVVSIRTRAFSTISRAAAVKMMAATSSAATTSPW